MGDIRHHLSWRCFKFFMRNVWRRRVALVQRYSVYQITTKTTKHEWCVYSIGYTIYLINAGPDTNIAPMGKYSHLLFRIRNLPWHKLSFRAVVNLIRYMLSHIHITSSYLLVWIYEVRDLFPAGPISVIFVFYTSISCNCDFSSQSDFWSRFWIPPQIFWWIHTRKLNNRGVVTTTGREMAKTTLTSG